MTTFYFRKGYRNHGRPASRLVVVMTMSDDLGGARMTASPLGGLSAFPQVVMRQPTRKNKKRWMAFMFYR